MDRRWWTLIGVCAGVFMLLLDVTIVNVALPDIGHAFHASLADLQWVLDAYALALAALLLTAGSLADRFGRRRLFAVGTALFTAGSLLCGTATSTVYLVAARAGQGVGGAVMFATSLALLAQAFQGRDRGTAFGVFGAVTGVAVAVGPVLGGVLTSGPGWRWIFFVNVPIGVAVVAVTLRYAPESRDPAAHRPDWAGFVTFSGALGALVYGLIRSNADGWSAPAVVGSLTTAGVLLAAFVVVEWRGRSPMFDFALLRKPTFSGGLLAAFGISAGLFSLLTYLVLYFQNVLGYSAADTGIRLLVLTAAIFVMAAIAGRLSASVPARLLIAPGFVLVGVGLLLMHGITPTSSWTHLVPGLAMAGAGAGLVNVPLANTAVGVVRPERAGMASGVNSTFRQVGIATGIAVLGSVFAARMRGSVTASLADTPLAPHAHDLAATIASGGTAEAIGSTAPTLRPTLALAARTGFVTGLNDIILVGAITALVVGVACAFLVRQKDFVAPGPHPVDDPGSQPEATAAEESAAAPAV